MNDQERIIQNWMIEFDKLHREQHQKSSTGIRFIWFKGEWMSVTEFIKKKSELLNNQNM